MSEKLTNEPPAGLVDKDIAILLLEDYHLDAELMRMELMTEHPNWSVTHASNREEFVRSLENQPPDVIVSDYAMPQFTGLEALELVQAQGLEIPFILVTGQLPESAVLELSRKGVEDYVIKSSLMRLGMAVRKALERRESVLASRDLSKNLMATESRFTALFHHSGVPMGEIRFHNSEALRSGKIRLRKLDFSQLVDVLTNMELLLVNQAFLNLFGARDMDELQARWRDVFLAEEKTAIRYMISGLVHRNEGFEERLEFQGLASGKFFGLLRFSSVPEETDHYILNITDITDVKRSEKRLGMVLSQLEETVRQRTADLSIANSQLQEQASEREQMNDVLRTNFIHMTESIIAAKQIQQLMLPKRSQIDTLFAHSFVYWRPKDIVSGDFYWYYQKGQQCWIAAVDCTGHGVPGAFMSMNAANYLNQVVIGRQTSSTAEIMNAIDELVVREMRQHDEATAVSTGMDMSICHFDFDAMQLTFSGAFHKACFFREGRMELLMGDRQSVGGKFKVEDKRFTEQRLTVQKGDRFYLTSDGYQDQFGGPRDKKFGTRQYQSMLGEIQHLALFDQEMELKTRFQDWKGRTEQVDDILVIGLEV